MVEKAREECGMGSVEEVTAEHPVYLIGLPPSSAEHSGFSTCFAEGTDSITSLVCPALMLISMDQMAVHVPSAEAQAESQIIMLSSQCSLPG